MKKSIFNLSLIVFFGALVLSSCGGGKSDSNSLGHDPNEVYVWSLSDPDMLNPTNYQSADAGYIVKRIFSTFLWLDFKTLKLVPYLADSLPEIKENADGSVDYTYHIRKEAKWDDGTPITAKDAEFSVKVMMCPLVNDEHQKPYFEKFTDVVLYPEDPQKITLHMKERYIQGVSTSGDFFILPQKVYDPENILAGYTYKQIIEGQESLKKDPKIKKFADAYNGENFKREKAFISGSGPYVYDRWETNQRIVIKKKDNWWGASLAGLNTAFENHAPTIVYEVVKDQTTAVTAMKGLKLDVLYGIKPKDFLELKESESVKNNFNLHTPNSLSYAYFGLNTRNPKFADKKVRQALAHLVDVQKFIKTLYYDMAVQVTCDGIPYADSASYNFDIKPYPFDINTAKSMLKEAGWEDTDGDGFLDKVINGKKTKFTIDYTFNSGNDIRESAGLIFKENARQVGIDVNVTGQEWAAYIDNQKNHKFEMFYGAWIKTPVNKDPKQIWHSSSYDGGSNYVGFGTPETDALIEKIRTSVDDATFNENSKKLQAIQHDECAYLFLLAPKERISIHKRFTDAYTTVMRPGFNEAAFTTGAAKASAK